MAERVPEIPAGNSWCVPRLEPIRDHPHCCKLQRYHGGDFRPAGPTESAAQPRNVMAIGRVWGWLLRGLREDSGVD
jgi:hypothetical protein